MSESNGKKEEQIRRIIRANFDEEIEYKKYELDKINQRIYDAQNMLDKLRVCVICNYYSLNGRLSLKEYMNHPAVAELKCEHLDMVVEHVKSVETSLPCPSTANSDSMGFTQQFDVQIFAGNVSKFLNPENKSSSRMPESSALSYSQTATQYDQDLITHRWMVYIRSPNCARLENYVRKVVFYLHSSYKPHDMIEVKSPPFQLIRRGWGEFPVHVQIHFKDARNKRVDINHQLKLDWTQTGLQTFGGETSCQVRLSLKPNDFKDNHQSSSKNTPASNHQRIQQDFNIDSPMMPEEPVAHKRRLSTSSSGSSSRLTFKKVHSNSGLRSDLAGAQTLNNMTNFEEMINSFATPCQEESTSKNRLDVPVVVDEENAASTVNNNQSLRDSTSTTTHQEVASQSYPNEQFLKLAVPDWSVIINSFESLLKLVLKRFPLVLENYSASSRVKLMPFCATSLSDYKSWPYGKRRGNEWMRAKSIQRECMRLIVANAIHLKKIEPAWSTKRIMLWLRSQGYTPLEPQYVEGKVTTISNETVEYVSSFATATLQGLIPNVNMNSVLKSDENEYVDVMNETSPSQKGNKFGKHQVRLNESIDDSVETLAQDLYVREQLDMINLRVKPLGLKSSSSVTKCNLVERMMYQLAGRFAQDLIRQACSDRFAQSNGSNKFPSILCVKDLFDTMLRHERFDFLSNKFMTVRVDNNKPQTIGEIKRIRSESSILKS